MRGLVSGNVADAIVCIRGVNPWPCQPGANNVLYFPQRMCFMCSIRLERVDIVVGQRVRMVVPKPRREIFKALSDLGRIDVLINNGGLGGHTLGFPSVAAVAMAQLHRLTGVNLLPGRRRHQSTRL
jgi:hypothetical protein